MGIRFIVFLGEGMPWMVERGGILLLIVPTSVFACLLSSHPHIPPHVFLVLGSLILELWLLNLSTTDVLWRTVLSIV